MKHNIFDVLEKTATYLEGRADEIDCQAQKTASENRESISSQLIPALALITERTGEQFSEEKISSIIESGLHEDFVKIAKKLSFSEEELPLDVGGPSPFAPKEARSLKRPRTRRRSSHEIRQA